ncbi:MAG TPA: DDE-type integrase/transposase/recombinase [Pseudonocardiaceae bacterium]|nr:DDE-type integrase/transposase/recombinase [Pseudonocardiaceae bacterium]
MHIRFGPGAAGKGHATARTSSAAYRYPRALVGYRWGHSEDTVRLAAALRPALAARGVPRRLYVDNGSAFCDAQLLRACACLGIQLVHSRPGKPAGRGKIERVFRTVREQFLRELAAPGAEPVRDLAHLNELFTAWVEQVYHRRVHTETDQPPLQRFLAAGPPPVPSAESLREAFLWSARRTVTKTATLSFEGNLYEVDAALVGRRVELVYDPFDLTRLQVRYDGRDMGEATPQRIGRHVHTKTRTPTPPAPTSTGIDYLNLVHTRHSAELAQRLRYDRLPTEPARPEPASEPVGADPALEAELAAFAALRTSPSTDPPVEHVPGQLDLATLLDADQATHGGPAS